LKVKILYHVNVAGLEQEVNAFLESLEYGKFNDIKYASHFNRMEDCDIFSAMVTYFE